MHYSPFSAAGSAQSATALGHRGRTDDGVVCSWEEQEEEDEDEEGEEGMARRNLCPARGALDQDATSARGQSITPRPVGLVLRFFGLSWPRLRFWSLSKLLPTYVHAGVSSPGLPVRAAKERVYERANRPTRDEYKKGHAWNVGIRSAPYML